MQLSFYRVVLSPPCILRSAHIILTQCRRYLVRVLHCQSMALFDQYHRAASISTDYASRRSFVPEMTSSGIISAKLEDDVPMFSKQKINFKPGDNITHMIVCNNQLVLGMKNKIRRINLLNPDSIDDISLAKAGSDDVCIYELFLDPDGKHLLVSMVNTQTLEPFENFYLFHSSKKPQTASKMKGHVISAVGWNYQNRNETATSSILVGTTKGLIFETELAFEERFFQSTPEQFWKQVYDLDPTAEKTPFDSESSLITGLEYYKVPSGKFVVLAATPSRITEFIGNVTSTEPPILVNIFNRYKEVPGFHELPGNLPYSKLQLYYPKSSADGAENPQKLAWMTDQGVLIGDLNHDDPETFQNCVRGNSLLPYKEKKPLSIALTEFHLLILFHDRVKIYSTLEKQLVYEDVFAELYGSLLGIVKDPVKHTIWVYSDQVIYRYSVIREDRNVWAYYLDQQMFDKALLYCKGDEEKLNQVFSKQADVLFEQKEYDESAKVFAKVHGSFEAIALKFLQAEQESAIKVLLREKLDRLDKNDKTQITMTVLWLIELYLNELGVMRNSGRQHLDSYKKLQAEFRGLFDKDRVATSVSNNQGAVYKLMSSHGDEENLIYFAKKMKDDQKVIQYYIEQKDFNAALERLTKQSRIDLFYKFSPALIRAIPQKTVTAWIGQGYRLDPAKLIPALVHYEHQRETGDVNYAIVYLEHCVYNLQCKDPAVHNYLLSLYAHSDHKKLKTYLEAHGQDCESVLYDQKFALRLCAELGLDEACVHMYTTMGHYEEAVDLALKVDTDLAKQNANLPEDDEELKKKLWLKIAEHVVKKKNDIKEAMEFLRQCDLIKIEDILPFFPDFVTIDHFKDAICFSLQKYNEHIDSLKEEMAEATQSAQDIRSEIQAFRNRYNLVKAEQKCEICSYPIVSRSFYIFPCQHMFHSNCLIDEVRPHLLPTNKYRVEEIQRQLQMLSGRDDTVSVSSTSVMSDAVTFKEKLCNELDDLVASECILCGEIMIRSIDVPFIPLESYGEELKSWI